MDQSRTHRIWIVAWSATLILLLALVGCGGGGGPPPPPPVTPSGTYTIAVTATSSAVGVNPVTAQFTAGGEMRVF